MISFTCPSCDRKLQAGDSKAGRNLACPSCKSLITVPFTLDEKIDDENSRTEKISIDDLAASFLDEHTVKQKFKKCRLCGERLDMDAIKCRSCGEFVAEVTESSLGVRGVDEEPTLYGRSIEQRPVPATPITTDKPKSSKFAFLLLGLIVFFCSGIVFYPTIRGVDRSPARSDTATNTPTYRDVLQTLVDEVDSNLKSDVFGEVTVNGMDAQVVLEASYFVKMTPEVQRYALESIRDIWFTKCNGKSILFKTWNGEVIAKF